MAACGGRLEIADNLGGGASVTLTVPARRRARRAPGLLGDRPHDPRPAARGGQRDARTRWPRSSGARAAECGRELILLQHRGLVAREPVGRPPASPSAGTSLVATLF